MTNAIESQHLSHSKRQEYQHLGYYETTDKFIFCNKESYSRDDTESLAKQVVKQTNKTIEEAKTETSDQMITELKYKPCLFNRDVLFSIVLLDDSELAGQLKQRNTDRNLTVEVLHDLNDKVYSWYYYSNQAPILSFVNNEWRDEHAIDEKLVILDRADLNPTPYFLRFLLGFSLDTDFIMVNQVMFTFRRENGYLRNNSTSEQWVWRDHHFRSTLQHPTYDFDNEYFTWFCMFLIYKVARLWSACIGFMFLSFVNGLVVRVALISSNVVIFPLLWIIKVYEGQPMNPHHLAQIY